MRKRKPLLTIAMYLIVCIATVTATFPFVYIFLTSLKSEEQIFSVAQIIPSYITIGNFVRVVINDNFFNYFKNSAVVAVITTFICIILATLAAYGFSRFNIIGAKRMRMGILYTRMFPGILLSIPYYTIMRGMKLTDSLTGLVIIYCSFSLPFCIWNLRAYFESLPWEIEESAFIDGASRLRAFISVVMPMAKPGMMSTALLAFITSWDEFMFANLFISSTSRKTVQLGVYSFIGEYSTDWGGLMAAAVISMLPVITFFAIVQKSLVTGITAGAVKG